MILLNMCKRRDKLVNELPNDIAKLEKKYNIKLDQKSLIDSCEDSVCVDNYIDISTDDILSDYTATSNTFMWQQDELIGLIKMQISPIQQDRNYRNNNFKGTVSPEVTSFINKCAKAEAEHYITSLKRGVSAEEKVLLNIKKTWNLVLTTIS